MTRDIYLQLVEQKMSTRKIASVLNISQGTVKYWLGKYGLKTERKVNTIGGYKTCPRCLVDLELTNENFYITKTGRVHSWCKKCNNSISWNKQKQMKLKSVAYKGGKCCLCGYSKYVGSMDFHHMDPELKDFSLSELRTYSWEKIKNELDKCILVCRNCHGELHRNVVDPP